MRHLLRRFLLALLADDIEALLNRALIESDVYTLDGEEFAAQIKRGADAVFAAHERQRWGKD